MRTTYQPRPKLRHLRALVRLARVGAGWAEQDSHQAAHRGDESAHRELALVADLFSEAGRRLEDLRARVG